MAIDSYAEGMSYENFMKRAFQTSDNNKPGIHLSNMKNLIDAESGESWVSHLPPAKKQLEKVKNYIEKAFVKLIKLNKEKVVKSQLSDLKMDILESQSADELSHIIRQALDLTRS